MDYRFWELAGIIYHSKNRQNKRTKKVFLFFCLLGPHPAVIRAFSWLCGQKLFLASLVEQNGWQELNLGLFPIGCMHSK